MNTANLDTLDKITLAFRRLRENGYFAAKKHEDCQTCGVSAIPENLRSRFVFYSEQDAASIKNRELIHPLYLAWAGDARYIISVLEEFGLATSWNGDKTQRIAILPKTYKKIFLKEYTLTDTIYDWLHEADADELARVAGELFGGTCFLSHQDKEANNIYEFTPDENYYGAFECRKEYNPKDD